MEQRNGFPGLPDSFGFFRRATKSFCGRLWSRRRVADMCLGDETRGAVSRDGDGGMVWRKRERERWESGGGEWDWDAEREEWD